MKIAQQPREYAPLEHAVEALQRIIQAETPEARERQIAVEGYSPETVKQVMKQLGLDPSDCTHNRVTREKVSAALLKHLVETGDVEPNSHGHRARVFGAAMASMENVGAAINEISAVLDELMGFHPQAQLSRTGSAMCACVDWEVEPHHLAACLAEGPRLHELCHEFLRFLEEHPGAIEKHPDLEFIRGWQVAMQ